MLIRQRRIGTSVAKFSDEPGCRLGLSRRQFVRTASGMAVTILSMNQVYGRIFEVHKAKAVASGQSVLDDGPSDLACFAAEHWNPSMLEDFYLAHRRCK